MVKNMYADFHLHTHYSGDSNADPDAVVQAAINSGIKIMCVTDHRDLDLPEYLFNNISFSSINYDEYFSFWHDMREKYKDKIDIKIGIEAGVEPETAERQAQCVKSFPFDFVISSVHTVTREYPYYPDFIAKFGTRKTMDMYFGRINSCLDLFTDFDVLGHIDFIVRYTTDKAGYVYENHRELLDEILKKAISLGKGIEINSAGYRHDLTHPNPRFEIIKRYKELGGEILTFGSDAHKPSDVAADFDRTSALAKEAGFKYYCVFKNRKPEFLPL